MAEEVNHPAHYGGDEIYEVIKVLRAWDLELAKGFCWGNCIKYQARAGKKGSAVQDRMKAEWYATELVSIEAELEGRKQPKVESGPLAVWPALGSEWIWEKDNPDARCRVKVTAIGKAVGNEFVTCKVITRDPAGTCVIGTQYSNDLSRWHEAVTPLPDWPYSWEHL